MSSIRMKADSSEVVSFLKETSAKVEKGFRTMAEQSLDITENAQILAYGQNSRPPKPAGSKYIRTFKLWASSKRRIRNVSSAGFTAEWYTNLVYAPFVLGTVSQQAPFHRGRWKSIEAVIAIVNNAIGTMIDKTVSKVFK